MESIIYNIRYSDNVILNCKTNLNNIMIYDTLLTKSIKNIFTIYIYL